MLPPSFPRRELLRLLGAGLVAGFGSACVGRVGDESVTDPAALRLLHSNGRLAARPGKVSPREAPPRGVVRLGLSASERDGVVYRPSPLRADRPAPCSSSSMGRPAAAAAPSKDSSTWRTTEACFSS